MECDYLWFLRFFVANTLTSWQINVYFICICMSHHGIYLLLVACGKCRWVIAKCARFSSFFWPPVGWNADGQTYSIALLPHAPTHNLFIHAYINLYLYPQTTINTYPFATICCDCSCLKVVVFVLLFWQFKIWLNWS